MANNRVMRCILLFFLIILFLFFITCDKVTVEITAPALPVHQKDKKPDTPVPLGCIRGYFGDYYKTFTQQIEKVQSIDSFSNIYFYGGCNDNLKQINLIRSDGVFLIALYILGYALDSLPSTLPVPSEYGKYTEIQFYSLQNSSWGKPGYYLLDDFYGKSVFITDITDDILTGTFEGILRSSTGDILPVSEGEFKIKIFQKYTPCEQSSE